MSKNLQTDNDIYLAPKCSKDVSKVARNAVGKASAQNEPKVNAL